MASKRKRPPPGARKKRAITALEREVISMFVQFSRLVGYPKSVAQIYGLLFISAEPLAMADFMEKLSLSKGATSEGLKVLRSLKAVRRLRLTGERADRYEPEIELRQLMRGILGGQVRENLEDGFERLTRAEEIASRSIGDRAHLVSRLAKLRAWEKRSAELVMLARLYLERPA